MIDKETVWIMYNINRMTIDQIAKKLGTTYNRLWDFMDRNKIKRRSIREVTTKYNFDKKEIQYLYYKKKLSLDKIAELKKCSMYAIYFFMKNNNIKRRTVSKSVPKGDKHPAWTGDNVSYISAHNWVKDRKLKPKLCERCKKNRKLELSNNDGNYNRDVNNYEWICRFCHRKKDKVKK